MCWWSAVICMPLFTALLLPLIFGCPFCQSSREMWKQRKCLFPSKQRIFSVHRERQRKTRTMTQQWYYDVKQLSVSVQSNTSPKNDVCHQFLTLTLFHTWITLFYCKTCQFFNFVSRSNYYYYINVLWLKLWIIKKGCKTSIKILMHYIPSVLKQYSLFVWWQICCYLLIILVFDNFPLQ